MWYHSQGMWKKKYFHYTISIAIGMSLGHVYLFIFLKRLLSLLFLLFSLSDYASRAMPNRRTVTYQLRSREWEGPTVWTVSSVCVCETTIWLYAVLCMYVCFDPQPWGASATSKACVCVCVAVDHSGSLGLSSLAMMPKAPGPSHSLSVAALISFSITK